MTTKINLKRMCYGVVMMLLFVTPGLAQGGLQNSGFVKGGDVHLMYQPDAEVYGLEWGGDVLPFLGMVFQLNSNLKFGSDSYTSYGLVYGIGLSPRYMIGDKFLIQGKLYPYISLDHVSEPETTIGKKDSKYHYTYRPDGGDVYLGAMADLQLGFKVAEIKDKPFFVTVGYRIYAPKFKTGGMFDYGYFMLGLSLVRF